MSTSLFRLAAAILSFAVGLAITSVSQRHNHESNAENATAAQTKSKALNHLPVQIEQQPNVPLQLESLMTGEDDIVVEGVHFTYRNITNKVITDYVVDCNLLDGSMCGSMNSLIPIQPNERRFCSFDYFRRLAIHYDVNTVILSIQAVNFSDGTRWERAGGRR